MTGAGKVQGSRFKEQGSRSKVQGSRGKVSRAECSGIGECKIQGMGEFKKCVNSRNGRIQGMLSSKNGKVQGAGSKARDPGAVQLQCFSVTSATEWQGYSVSVNAVMMCQ